MAMIWTILTGLSRYGRGWVVGIVGTTYDTG